MFAVKFPAPSRMVVPAAPPVMDPLGPLPTMLKVVPGVVGTAVFGIVRVVWRATPSTVPVALAVPSTAATPRPRRSSARGESIVTVAVVVMFADSPEPRVAGAFVAKTAARS